MFVQRWRCLKFAEVLVFSKKCDENKINMKTVFTAILYFLGLVGSGLCAAHANPDPSILGDNMQSFTEDPYMTDEKFREKGKFDTVCVLRIYAFIIKIFTW